MAIQFSPIQNHILSKLKNANTLRYSDMQPDKIPNDLYNYHLQFLVKKGFVLKNDDGYFLSPTGIKHVADPYPENNAITSLFKINVITIVSRIVDGKNGKQIEILNQIRKSNPSYGKIGVPGGVVLKGELIEPAATRKLKQETGLNAQFRLVGCERRIMYKSGELFSDLMFPIAYADSSSGDLLIESNFGHNMWVPIDEAIKNESADFDSLNGIRIALKAIRDGSIKTLPFFFEENIPLSTQVSRGSFFFPLLSESNIIRIAILPQLRMIDAKRLIKRMDIISLAEYRFVKEKITKVCL